MKTISFEKTELPGLWIVHPFMAGDERGCSFKQFEQGIFKAHGIMFQPYEELMSQSGKGVIRGLHFQRNYSQDKLVRVLRGAVYDVAVDLRKESPTFGKWKGIYLSAENRRMLYVPKGFAHGFLALEEGTLFHYLCGDRYDPESEGGILWSDPELSIEWPLDLVEQTIISEKDRRLPTFAQFQAENSVLFAFSGV